LLLLFPSFLHYFLVLVFLQPLFLFRVPYSSYFLLSFCMSFLTYFVCCSLSVSVTLLHNGKLRLYFHLFFFFVRFASFVSYILLFPKCILHFGFINLFLHSSFAHFPATVFSRNKIKHIHGTSVTCIPRHCTYDILAARNVSVVLPYTCIR
jgi:hypothetical protein